MWTGGQFRPVPGTSRTILGCSSSLQKRIRARPPKGNVSSAENSVVPSEIVPSWATCFATPGRVVPVADPSRAILKQLVPGFFRGYDGIFRNCKITLPKMLRSLAHSATFAGGSCYVCWRMGYHFKRLYRPVCHKKNILFGFHKPAFLGLHIDEKRL